MKKFLSSLLALILALSLLPFTALAAETELKDTGDLLVLRGRYVTFCLQKSTGAFATEPTVNYDRGITSDAYGMPQCQFIVYDQNGEIHRFTGTSIKSAKAVSSPEPHIEAEYLVIIPLVGLEGFGFEDFAEVTVPVSYYLADSNSGHGVLAYVANGVIADRDKFYNSDSMLRWIFTLNAFSLGGHNGQTAPALTLNSINVDGNGLKESSVTVTAPMNDLPAVTYPSGWNYDHQDYGLYIKEARTEGYSFANAFAASGGYSLTDTVKTVGGTKLTDPNFPREISVSPGMMSPVFSSVSLYERIFYTFPDEGDDGSRTHFFWGYYDLVDLPQNVPTKPDEVKLSLSAKRLAAFYKDGKTTVEFVSDDSALANLKKTYSSDPIAEMWGEIKSADGRTFTFTGNNARLSPTVTATWGNGGSLTVTRDGVFTQNGVNLNTPTFKLYEPAAGKADSLKIAFSDTGLKFDIDPKANNAIAYIDIPYTTVAINGGTADTSGNIRLTGDMSIGTVLDGASFTMEELGYGLKNNSFKLNGIHATGSFDTEKLFNLELFGIEGEINTFTDEYSFSLELSAFDLFKTEAELALARVNGNLIPDKLWFYLKAKPGILLIPPVPIGQLNGGGAGFSGLAATVKGDYFAIPPIKLRGAVTGTYLHLVEGTANLTLGPSEIAVKATDVNIAGAGEATKIVDEFGYSVKLAGQTKNYKGVDYEGILLTGEQSLKLLLPNASIDVIEVESLLKAGAFGGVNKNKDRFYLHIGANGAVTGTLKVPSNFFIFPGKEFASATVNLAVGGQTVIPIKNVSVDEGFREAFKNIDIYIGAMAEAKGWLGHIRAWVIIPKVVQTNFVMGKGWNIEGKFIKHLPDWDWANVGITPLSVENGIELLALTGDEEITLDLSSSEDSEPYVLLSFDRSVTEEEIKEKLTVTKDSSPVTVSFTDGEEAEFRAVTNIMTKNDGNAYRTVLMYAPNANGTYKISCGGLTFNTEEASVSPYEKLDLELTDRELTGSVKYAEDGKTYTVRTYLSKTEGGADYLVSEDTVTGSGNITINIPENGTLAPTGSYFVTSFLMEEREADINDDGKNETALLSIASQNFDRLIRYENTVQPNVPYDVTLKATGNEVLLASWGAVEGADGYEVLIYQEDENGDLVTGGVSYDVTGTSVSMALTANGEFLPNRDYFAGVRAYKKFGDGKVCSETAISDRQYLLEFTPADITVKIDGDEILKSASGIYEYTVGRGEHYLTAETNALGVRAVREDTGAELTKSGDDFLIPDDFSGTLMIRISAVSLSGITDEFLLISRDDGDISLTLEDDIIYADRKTGAYKFSGAAEPGSTVYLIKDEAATAGGDSRFTIKGALEEDSNVLTAAVWAKDSSGNISASKNVYIVRSAAYSVTVNASEAAQNGSGEYFPGDEVKISAGTKSGYTFSGWKTADNITLADKSKADTTFTMIGSDVTVTAQWKKKSSSGGGGGSSAPVKFTVSFDANGGTKIENDRVEKNSLLSKPADPEKEGFIFTGWYSDKGLKTEYDFSEKVTKSFTLYAGWRKVKSTIVLTIGEANALINGKTESTDVPAKIVSDRTFLPVRFVAESLGAKVGWDGNENKVTITDGDKKIELIIGKREITVNGKTEKLDAAPFIEDSRTLVPVRFISEALGAKVTYDEKTKTVTIKK